jgi:RNA-directed DNA polymerase
MSLTTPGKIRELQIQLYRKAKNEPGFRFYQLYDKVYREDILNHAYQLARANHGAPGVDGESFEDIEAKGLQEWMNGLREELHDQTYEPQPVRRVMIPKRRFHSSTEPGGGERPLGIPTIRDRVAQTAAKLILEPIWEAEMEPNAYGYRRGTSAQGAIQKVDELLHEGYTDIVDADLSKYFDTIPHSELMQCVARRIVDRHMLHLIKMWLKVPDQRRRERPTLSADKDTSAASLRARNAG